MLENVIKTAVKDALAHRAEQAVAKDVAGEVGRGAGRQLRRAAKVEGAEIAAKVAGAEAKAGERRLGAVRDLTGTEIRSKAEMATMTKATTRNAVTFHVDSVAAHKALLDSIRNAKTSFYIETFIWHNDAAGNEVIQALADRVALAKSRGETFDAKVLIDWFGLRQGTGGATDTAIVDKLRAGGVSVKEFSRGYVDEGHLIPITHRKFYIQDGSQFMTGGRNIGDEYLHATYQNAAGAQEAAWHDLLYTVEGEETGRIIEKFYENWERAGGKVPPKAEWPATLGHPTGRVRVQSVLTNPHTGVHELEKAHLALVKNAETEIVVMYPYLSDDKLVAALRDAKRKNPTLSIKVILPANKEAGAEGAVYTLLNRESARQLMAEGVEFRMFAGGKVDGKMVDQFSHFKGLVVDRKVVSIGSANGDHRTMRKNHELNTLIADAATVADFVKQVVLPDWAVAEPLTHRELAKDTFWVRVKQTLLEWFDFIL